MSMSIFVVVLLNLNFIVARLHICIPRSRRTGRDLHMVPKLGKDLNKLIPTPSDPRFVSHLFLGWE